ncbi:MAG: hypothetical protein BHW31_07190 [Firmicutes bacterium CAG:110_56_8]|nr:MAG: hypothetical protein BHW31_07190 [Firmicutes bacterium CAG:110_56_8]
MKKRFVLHILAACMLLTLLAPRGFATETDPPVESCGDGLSWSLDGSTLTVSGSGAMKDFEGGAPWSGSADQIHTVVLTGGVTSVGAGAFTDYKNLTAVDFGNSLKEIGASSFEGCTNLTEVYCSGGMPSFNANCLWNGNNITIYCPVNNIWPSEYVEELETNFHGRLQVLTANGSDPYHFEGEVQVTSRPTEPTVPPTTQPATEPPTVPTTQPPTVPETTQATQAPETLPTQQTVPPTLPEEQKDSSPVIGILIGVLIVSGTLSLLLIGLLIYRRKRDEDYDD